LRAQGFADVVRLVVDRRIVTKLVNQVATRVWPAGNANGTTAFDLS